MFVWLSLQKFVLLYHHPRLPNTKVSTETQWPSSPFRADNIVITSNHSRLISSRTLSLLISNHYVCSQSKNNSRRWHWDSLFCLLKLLPAAGVHHVLPAPWGAVTRRERGRAPSKQAWEGWAPTAVVPPLRQSRRCCGSSAPPSKARLGVHPLWGSSWDICLLGIKTHAAGFFSWASHISVKCPARYSVGGVLSSVGF